MMIEKHISALLYRYQCVIVPGFGAFLTETKSASIDTDTNTFYPPKKLISFNANLKNNDGLLANHIALQEKISYEQAVEDIKKMVAVWTDQLENGDKLILKNIGDLTYNNEGSLVFYPNTPVNYLTDSFGLGSFTSPAIKREVYKAEVEELEEEVPVLFTPEKRKKNYSFLKYAAVFVAALSIGSAGFKVYYDNKIITETRIAEQHVQEQVNQEIQTATFFLDPMPAVKLTVKEDTAEADEELYYHIVANAFRSEANANKAVNQLKAQGFKARKLDKNKYGLYPVLYESHTTYEAAHENLNKIRKEYNKEAWLLVKDL
ncbi:SPOR domain-containing protein [Flavobacterium sp. C4GT6]|uniref:HU domain-containing protein n=1 Tax=Flavobacterium sp. C4GT6 TaxID=3103818 RepID=UPI002ED1F6C5